jgi:hypothetical protein
VAVLEGATKVRGLAVDPSLQLVKTYPVSGEMVTVQFASGVQESVIGVR